MQWMTRWRESNFSRPYGAAFLGHSAVLADCWIGRSWFVWAAYGKFVWRSPRQGVWRRWLTRFLYWGWYFGSWVAWWPFRWRLSWIAGCRRLYLRRFDRRGHFRCCLDRCQRSQSNRALPVVCLYLRRKHVAQRTAGLSVQSRCHDRAPNFECAAYSERGKSPSAVNWRTKRESSECFEPLQAII
jgi:hypothetical protein